MVWERRRIDFGVINKLHIEFSLDCQVYYKKTHKYLSKEGISLLCVYIYALSAFGLNIFSLVLYAVS